MSPTQLTPGDASDGGAPSSEEGGVPEPLDIHEPPPSPPLRSAPPRTSPRAPVAAPPEPVVLPVREDDRDARVHAAWCHLAGLLGYLPFIAALGSVIGPLAVWLTWRLDDSLVDDQGLEVVNYKLNVLIVGLFLFVFSFTPYVQWVTLPLLGLLMIVDVALTVLGAIHASHGERYRYPMLFRPIKTT